MTRMIDDHKNSVLQFSGGKDSLACLWLLQPDWERLTVLWVNTGAALPEVHTLMAKVRDLVPNFRELRTDQAAQIQGGGFPVDVLPVRSDANVQYLTQQVRPRLQRFIDCCYANLMAPLYAETKRLSATLVIRGQKITDKHKSPIRSGHVEDGITYWFPLEDWTDADVTAYLADKPIGIPESYQYFNSSSDCWNCTAYLEDNVGKMRYLRERHPRMHKEVMRRLRIINTEVKRDHAYLGKAMAA